MDLAAKKAAARERARRAREVARGVAPGDGVSITKAAAEYIRKAAAPAESPLVIVSVHAGGCAGLEWSVDLLAPDTEIAPGETETTEHGIRIRQGLRTRLHLAQSVLDYGGDQFSRGFRLETPSGVARCSCGSSLGA